MPETWKVSYLILYGDGFFNYSVEVVKFLTNLTFGFELSLKFAFPSSYKWDDLIYTGFFCLIVAWIADSYLGKFYVTLLGVFLAVISSFLITYRLFESAYDGKIMDNFILSTSILILSYLTTANIRNNLILDQIRTPRRVPRLRKYLFYLVYTKLFGRVIVRFLIMIFSKYSNIMYPIFVKVTVLTSVLLAICYFITILSLGNKIYFEPFYFMIWEKCIMCLIKVVSKKTQSTYKQSMTLSGKSVFSSIYEKDQPKKKTVTFGTVETKPGSVIEELTNNKSHNDSNSPEGSPPSQGILNVHKPILSKPAITKSTIPIKTKNYWLLNYLPNFWGDKAKRLRSIEENAMSLMDKHNVNQILEEKVESWKPFVGPDCSPFVIFQSIQFFQIIWLLLAGVSFSLLTYFISETTLLQEELALKPNPSERLELFDVAMYSILFDLFLFPFVEFLLVPLLNKIVYRDIQYTLIGNVFLLSSAILTFVIQVYLEINLQFVPRSGVAQLRIFNGLSSPTEVRVYLIGRFRINSYGTEFIKDIPIKGKQVNWRIIVKGQGNLTIREKIVLFEKRAVSLTITQHGLIKTGDADPTIFKKPKERDDAVAYYFVVSPFVVVDGTIEFIQQERRVIFKETRILIGKENSLIEGKYFIIYYENNSSKAYNLTNPTLLKAGAMYVLFIHKLEPRLEGDAFLVEGPLPVFYEYLLFQELLLSLAQAFATISYFRLIYLESPSKLRCSMFNIIFMFNFFVVGLLNTEMLKYYGLRQSRILLVFITFEFGILLMTITFSSKFQYIYEGH